MTENEKLNKILEKASSKNSELNIRWIKTPLNHDLDYCYHQNRKEAEGCWNYSNAIKDESHEIEPDIAGCELMALIFSHPFVRAYWGEKSFYSNGSDAHSIPGWEYYIQQLALIETLEEAKKFADTLS